MLRQYTPDELKLACSYQVYLRWRTHRNRRFAELSSLEREVLASLVVPHDIRVLECRSDERNVLSFVSLGHEEPVSACVSKLKGKVSKMLRQRIGSQAPDRLLSRGYFACTYGKSSAETIEEYLSRQGKHHGYEDRPCPPVYVKEYPPSSADEARLHPKHGRAVLRFHLVLPTQMRLGILGARSGEALAQRWRELGQNGDFGLIKISVVPDHVHLAVRAHPKLPPGSLVLSLMNTGQETMFESFLHDVRRVGASRVWQPGAYIGAYGDFESPKIRKYIRDWEGLAGHDG